jgi:glycine/D-amino acid oxidase-like deaminating enzyme
MRNPGVVIVGAGVMGASAAYHLAARGRRDVLVIDCGSAAGEGSTSRATGGFRAQYGTAINVRLSLLTRSKLRRFSDEVGGECGYVPAGYLWLASSAGVLKGLAEARALQHAEGLTEATGATPDEVALINPAIALDGILGGSFCPTDGFVHPLGILNGYLEAAQRLGVDVSWGEEAVDAERSASGRITALLTTRRRIATDMVINAAGAWAGAFGSACGLNVPVSPLRRQVALTEPTRALPDSMPMTIFTDDGFHLRVRDGRVLLLWPTPGLLGRPFDATVDAEWIDAVTAKAHARVPVLRDVPVDSAGSWAGLYEMSPDKHAILGAHPECENLFLINGSSGHGVMHAPALGHLLAEVVLDGRATTIDTHALRPERFSEGDLNESAGPL